MPQQLDSDLDFDLDLDIGEDFNLGEFAGDVLGGDVDFAAEPSEPDPLASVKYIGSVEADTKSELNAMQTAFADRAKRENARRMKATDSEYWVCLCFQSREQVEEFLAKTGWAKPSEKYLDGQQVARAIGVALKPDEGGFGNVRIDSKLEKLTGGKK